MSDYFLAFLTAVALLFVTWSFRELIRVGPNPVLAHNLSWAVAFGVFSLHWVAYTDVSSLAWIALVFGIVAFNCGALIPVTLRRSKSEASMLHATSLAWATKVLPILFMLGTLVYLRAVATSTGLDSLIHGASIARTFQGSEEFGVVFPIYGRLLYFLGPLVFVLYANPWLSGIKVSRNIRVAVLCLTLFGLALALGRTLLLITLVWQAAIVYVRPHRRRTSENLRRVVTLGVLGLAAIFAFQALAVFTGKTGQADTRIQPYARGPIRSNAATSLVTYSSGGIPAFSALLADTSSHSWGEATFGPVTKAIPTLNPPKQVGAFVNIPFPHNAFTWLETYYRDFGVPGAIFLPFVMGVFVAHFCRPCFGSSETLLIGALLLGLGLWAPLVNHLPSTFTWEYLVILLISRTRHPRVAISGQGDKKTAIGGRPASVTAHA